MEKNVTNITHGRYVELSHQDFLGFKHGEEIGFQKIFNLYYEILFYYAIKFLKQHEEAEELVQEAFVSLFLNRDQFKDPTGIYPYLFTVSKRMIISRFRRKVVENKYDIHLQHHWSEEMEGTTESINVRELNIVLQQAIDTLPTKQKVVYAMSKFDGLSYQEIADKIGVSKNTVKNHLISASKRVKSIINRLYLILLIISLLK